MRKWMFGVLGAAAWALSQTAGAACLRKAVKADADNVVTAYAMAPEAEVPSLLSQGYKRVACATDLTLLRQQVKQICEGVPRGAALASRKRDAFEQGRSRACASARAALAEVRG